MSEYAGHLRVRFVYGNFAKSGQRSPKRPTGMGTPWEQYGNLNGKCWRSGFDFWLWGRGGGGPALTFNSFPTLNLTLTLTPPILTPTPCLLRVLRGVRCGSRNRTTTRHLPITIASIPPKQNSMDSPGGQLVCNECLMQTATFHTRHMDPDQRPNNWF